MDEGSDYGNDCIITNDTISACNIETHVSIFTPIVSPTVFRDEVVTL
jgi:hypothetical protein